jgi:LysM repeat protein
MSYTVKEGDSLSVIGERLGMDWREIARVNNINPPYVIFPNQILMLPDEAKTIVVRAGDTLSELGEKAGVSWQEIAELNNIKAPYVIFPQQVLKMPGKGGGEKNVQLNDTASGKKYTGKYADLINASASRYGVDPYLVASVIQQESGFNQSAVSGAGAIGIMQLMPGTAQGLGVNPYDVAQNIDGGVKLLSQLLRQFGGNVAFALAGYNAGPGAVQKYGGVPPYAETQNYVRSIMAIYNGSGSLGKV